MNFEFIETSDGEFLGVYVRGFVDKQLFLDEYNKTFTEEIIRSDDLEKLNKSLTVDDINYGYLKITKDVDRNEELVCSGKEDINSFEVTALYI